jgi:hypothetical protein
MDVVRKIENTKIEANATYFVSKPAEDVIIADSGSLHRFDVERTDADEN